MFETPVYTRTETMLDDLDIECAYTAIYCADCSELLAQTTLTQRPAGELGSCVVCDRCDRLVYQEGE